MMRWAVLLLCCLEEVTVCYSYIGLQNPFCSFVSLIWSISDYCSEFGISLIRFRLLFLVFWALYSSLTRKLRPLLVSRCPNMFPLSNGVSLWMLFVLFSPRHSSASTAALFILNCNLNCSEGTFMLKSLLKTCCSPDTLKKLACL